MGLDANSSQQSNQSVSTSQSGTYLDMNQYAYLGSLYDQAFGATNTAGAQQAAQQASGFTAPALTTGLAGLTSLTDPTSQIQAQEQALATGLGNLFSQEINPAIESGAIATGGFGGGRQGVAQGVAAGQIADAYTTGLADITAQANQTALAASGMMPALTDSLYSTFLNPQLAAFDPLVQLAGILGAPTILSQMSSQSTSSGQGESAGFGFNL